MPVAFGNGQQVSPLPVPVQDLPDGPPNLGFGTAISMGMEMKFFMIILKMASMGRPAAGKADQSLLVWPIILKPKSWRRMTAPTPKSIKK